MTGTPTKSEPLCSLLGEDPELRDIVELFVEEMAERISSLLDGLNGSDWEGLRRRAHQLKGAAGSYGFPPITDSASRLEEAIRKSHPEGEIRRLVEELVDLCGRAQAAP
ncbi:MAG: hypothetical protein A2V98_25680 [Planctomycetes bacterium RBG_16_64_12]|nr:MAG: hypothetical protein A2V98_25680 [Planctomycetes bacterium RBG_16_64_12]